MCISRDTKFWGHYQIFQNSGPIFVQLTFFPTPGSISCLQIDFFLVLWQMSQFDGPSLVHCNLECKSCADIDHSTKYSFLDACVLVTSVMSDSLKPHGLEPARSYSLFMGFSRQEYWSGLPFPSPGIFFANEGWKLDLLVHRQSPALRAHNWATREASQGTPVNKHFTWWCLFALQPEKEKVHWVLNDGYCFSWQSSSTSSHWVLICLCYLCARSCKWKWWDVIQKCPSLPDVLWSITFSVLEIVVNLTYGENYRRVSNLCPPF